MIVLPYHSDESDCVKHCLKCVAYALFLTIHYNQLLLRIEIFYPGFLKYQNNIQLINDNHFYLNEYFVKVPALSLCVY